jgi:hypothetical protein
MKLRVPKDKTSPKKQALAPKPTDLDDALPPAPYQELLLPDTTQNQDFPFTNQHTFQQDDDFQQVQSDNSEPLSDSQQTANRLSFVRNLWTAINVWIIKINRVGPKY